MVEPTMNAIDDLRKLLEEGDVDVLRLLVKQVAEALMGAEADALCGAARGERHPERVNSRNGYRARPGTRAPARSSWPCPSCARAATSPTGS